MSEAIQGLKPELVWKYFAEISRIPRGSKNEAAISKYVVDTAKKLGLTAKQDHFMNVVVKKPASAGKQSVSSICLQGHLHYSGIALSLAIASLAASATVPSPSK